MVCAHCRTQLRVPCGACARLLSYQWRHCPYCGTSRPRPQAEGQGAPGGREDEESSPAPGPEPEAAATQRPAAPRGQGPPA